MRRRVLTIAVFLLAGAVVNVAVAWGCAAYSCFMAELPDRWLESAEQEKVLQRTSNGDWPPDWPSWNQSHGRLDEQFGAERRKVLLHNVGSILISADICEYRFGWPIHSMHCHSKIWRSATGARKEIKNGRAFENGISWLGIEGKRIIPLAPIWSGFSINALVYAAILSPLILGPFALRHLIRRRRGLCPGCAYDLRHANHDACPECGVTA